MRSQEFAEFYQRENSALVRFAATIVGPDRADDVVANAVVSVMRRVMDKSGQRIPESVGELRPYVYRSVANAGAKEWRTIGRRDRREALAARMNTLPGGQDLPPWSGGDDVALALGQLSPRQRAVIHLTYWEDLTPAEVARRLDLSEGSVRRHLARARQNLRKTLKTDIVTDTSGESKPDSHPDTPSETTLGGAQ